MQPELVHYVNLETNRIVTDVNTIIAPDSVENYEQMNESQYQQYCIEQRRRLDASKLAHKQAYEDFQEAETERVESVATQISTTLGISIEDARLMVPRQQFQDAPDFTVSEKVFGDVALPEEVVHAAE